MITARPTPRPAVKPTLTEAIWRAAPYFAAIAERLEREQNEFATPFPPGCDAPTGATDSAPVVTGRGPTRRAS